MDCGYKALLEAQKKKYKKISDIDFNALRYSSPEDAFDKLFGKDKAYKLEPFLSHRKSLATKKVKSQKKNKQEETLSKVIPNDIEGAMFDVVAHSNFPVRKYAVATALSWTSHFPPPLSKANEAKIRAYLATQGADNNIESIDKKLTQLLQECGFQSISEIADDEVITKEYEQIVENSERTSGESSVKRDDFLKFLKENTRLSRAFNRAYLNNINTIKNFLEKMTPSVDVDYAHTLEKNKIQESFEKSSQSSRYFGKRHRYYFDAKDGDKYYLHCAWAKHERGFESTLFIEETDKSALSIHNSAIGENIARIQSIETGDITKDFFPFTALSRLKSNWSNWPLKFLNGANYTILPIEEFLKYGNASRESFENFEPRNGNGVLIMLEDGSDWGLYTILQSRSESEKEIDPRDFVLAKLAFRSSYQNLVARAAILDAFDLNEDNKLSHQGIIDKFVALSGDTDKLCLFRSKLIKAIIAEAHVSNENWDVIDLFIVRIIRTFLEKSFSRDDVAKEELEIAVSRINNNEAYYFSNLRPYPNGKEPIIFTNTIILDINLNSFVRGRILKTLADFSAERTFPFSVLRTMRTIHKGMTVINNSIDENIREWRQDGAEVNKLDFLHQHHFLNRLRKRNDELRYLDNLLPKNIQFWVRMTWIVKEKLDESLKILDESKVLGFLTVGDFVSQRWKKAANVIFTVGERHEKLKAKIDEYLSHIETETHIQAEEQSAEVLEKLDKLTNFGITYYFGYVIATVFIAISLLIYSSLPHHSESEIAKTAYQPIPLLDIPDCSKISKDQNYSRNLIECQNDAMRREFRNSNIEISNSNGRLATMIESALSANSEQIIKLDEKSRKKQLFEKIGFALWFLFSGVVAFFGIPYFNKNLKEDPKRQNSSLKQTVEKQRTRIQKIREIGEMKHDSVGNFINYIWYAISYPTALKSPVLLAFFAVMFIFVCFVLLILFH